MVERQQGKSSVIWSIWIGVALNVLMVMASYWGVSRSAADHSQTIVERIKAVEIDVQWLKKFCAGDVSHSRQGGKGREADDNAAMRGGLRATPASSDTFPAGLGES